MVNKKVYIGKHQTEDLGDGYLGSGKHLRRAIQKYGKETFVKEILYIFETENEMNSREAELVTEEWCSRSDTYNICSGGKGGWSYINREGLNNSEKARQKTSLRSREKRVWEKMVASQRSGEGRLRQLEALEKARASQTVNGFRGRNHSETSKAKMSSKNSEKQAGKGNSQFGTFWITNGSMNQKCRGDIPEGWRRGRVLRAVPETVC